MTAGSKGKNKKKAIEESKALSIQEKREIADREEAALEKEVIELSQWADMIDAMDDQQLREYLKNRPDNLKTEKIKKSMPRKKVQRGGKSGSSNTIMASVWKFHKEDDEGTSIY
ncbi:uncharacterized protein LOC131159330 [Malania oleifera]|uniref:uncharacterized protein LOC131159330 n=1 Tax=Malania oleifera TaxID=397392 RepID=UPI0025AEAC4F|nr:uncharacterized protein LOC131159330 [Malania oleifera]XP_057970167.1 uncharacterized protein LOC131159330 [Malania oleifera]